MNPTNATEVRCSTALLCGLLLAATALLQFLDAAAWAHLVAPVAMVLLHNEWRALVLRRREEERRAYERSLRGDEGFAHELERFNVPKFLEALRR